MKGRITEESGRAMMQKGEYGTVAKTSVRGGKLYYAVTMISGDCTPISIKAARPFDEVIVFLYYERTKLTRSPCDIEISWVVNKEMKE